MTVAIPFESRRRLKAQLVQKIQHVVPSIFLLGDGLRRVADVSWDVRTLLGVAEIVSAALVLWTFARTLRRTFRALPPGDSEPRHAHAHVDWLDVFLGAMLMTEALVHRNETGHLPRPSLLVAIVTLALGLAHGRFRGLGTRHRVFRMDDNGITVPGRFFTRWTATWAELLSIEFERSHARLRARDGRTRTIDLDDVVEGAAVRAALESARGRLA